ncbi:MAG TPA: hypothetical protein VH369_26090 [Bryobacteraceae bacterium]|jgi:hypothetical protein
MKLNVLPVVLLGLFVALPWRAEPQNMSSGSAVQVHLNYSGSGTVDAKHKIYVVLWDSPAFVEGGGVMPVEIKSATSKTGKVMFTDVKKSPAYVSAAFDPNGQWDGNSGPPPEGSSLGLYSKTPGKPEPINLEPGKRATVTVSFDDAVKMRSGKASRQAP